MLEVRDPCMLLMEAIVHQAACDRDGIVLKAIRTGEVDPMERYYHRDGRRFLDDWRFELICDLMGVDVALADELITRKEKERDAGIHRGRSTEDRDG